MRAGGNASQYIQNSCIHFSGISLPGYRITSSESHLFRDHRIDLVNGLLIPVKELQKACLGSCGSLGSQQFQAAKDIIQILQIHFKLLHPERRPLADCGRLCRLKMGKCKRRLCLILVCKPGKFRDHIDQLCPHQPQCLRHYDYIGIISHIAGCGAKVNNAFCLGALYTIGVHMRHHVMAHDLFSFLSHIIVDIFRMGL